MKSFKFMALVVCLVCFLISSTGAAVTQLTFEGLKNNEQILDFYNGGTGSLGSSGINYGIQFGSGALALIDFDNGGIGNFANEPSPNTVAYWLTGGGLIMNVAAGFDTGFSFYYTSSRPGTVTVFDDLNGTGNLLASISVLTNWQNNNCTGDPTGDFCNWDPIGVAFAGTAKSVNFSGTANQTAYDNITLGTADPRPVPEPGTFVLFGAGLAGVGLLRRKV